MPSLRSALASLALVVAHAGCSDSETQAGSGALTSSDLASPGAGGNPSDSAGAPQAGAGLSGSSGQAGIAAQGGSPQGGQTGAAGAPLAGKAGAAGAASGAAGLASGGSAGSAGAAAGAGGVGGVGGAASGAGGVGASGEAGARGGEGGASGQDTTGGGGIGEAGAGGDPAGGGAAGAGAAGQAGAGGAPCDDCDGDGWTAAQGDCCDLPGQCPGVDPAKVNPGAFDIPGNGVDDNCNQGSSEVADGDASCDAGLASGGAAELARALGICATTTEAGQGWGLIEAALLRADGSPLVDLRAVSTRSSFGSLATKALEGQRMVVLSTGIAADGTQTMPGPNGGFPEGTNVSTSHEPPSQVFIDKAGAPRSIADWFASENPPIKPAQSLPLLPGCPGQSSALASDSVLLALRVRAPNNARSFSFKTLFLSAEYPEYVCTSYSDQFIALVDGGGENPQDKNLLVYRDAQGSLWPASLNLALTPLFDHCDVAADKPACSKSKVHPQACSAGAGALAGTGFEAPSAKECSIGGASRWLDVAGNVTPGQVFELRIALWDVGDALFDSVALLDAFAWGTEPVTAGVTPAP